MFCLICQTGNDLGSFSTLVAQSSYSRHICSVPNPGRRVQTSSCPSISDKYRKDLNWAELWGSGAGPTSISYSCWWPGAEGKLSIEYCIQLSGRPGGGLRLVWRIISVPRCVLRLLSFRLVFGMASIRAGTGRGPGLHTCHGGNSCGPAQHH